MRSSSLFDHIIAVIILSSSRSSFIFWMPRLTPTSSLSSIFCLLDSSPGVLDSARAWSVPCSPSSLSTFFIPPRFTFHVSQWQDWIVLFVLLLESSTISYWVNRAQTSLDEARARERETTHLYELSISLAGLRSEEDIAFTIAEHLKDIFEADVVEVLTLTAPHRTVKTYRIPKVTPPFKHRHRAADSLGSPSPRVGSWARFGCGNWSRPFSRKMINCSMPLPASAP